MITQKQEYEMHERKRMPSKSMKTLGKTISDCCLE